MLRIERILQCVGKNIKSQHQHEHQGGRGADLPEETGHDVAVITRVADHHSPTRLRLYAQSQETQNDF
jgi:hypothetical protein